MASFAYTYRCPECLRDVSSYEIMVQRHEVCLDRAKNELGSLLVLVAIDGESVAGKNDPKAPVKAVKVRK